MDATVEQDDGLRFVYTLPFSPAHVLVEDTVLADGPELDRPRFRARALAHARRLGLDIAGIVREEHGVLPLPLAGDGPTVPAAGAPFAIGYQGGWFHPTTGYSLPAAVRLAWTLGALTPAQALAPDSPVRTLARELAASARFGRLLNRLLFRATPPAERWRVLERFHHLPDATIARFYRLEIRRLDRARIVCGRPPRGVSWRAAFTQLHPSAAGAAPEPS
jgi:lycopene beta-cyclase